jgi:thymidylate synthase (FAD)
MRIIEPYVEVEKFDPIRMMKKIEVCGRNCWKSEGKMTEDSYKTFLPAKIKIGHLSFFEHASVTVRFVVDRGVSHEIVRHRLASFSQESTRYCKYKNGITVIRPFFFPENTYKHDRWWKACRHAEIEYLNLVSEGATPQEARDVLPQSTKTDIIMTCNIREWRHVFEQRAATGAHPQMNQVMVPLFLYFKERMRPVFGDIIWNVLFPEEHYAEIREVDDIYAHVDDSAEATV